MKLDNNTFLNKIFANLDSAGIDYSGLELDHIAYRTTTRERYDELKAEFENGAKLLDEAIIRNRPIAIFKLNEPIVYEDFIIPYFELMAPAEGDSYAEGLEHAEFVISEGINEFRKRYSELDFEFKDRKINPELVLKFDNNANIKFHLRNIEEVLRLQKETGEL